MTRFSCGKHDHEAAGGLIPRLPSEVGPGLPPGQPGRKEAGWRTIAASLLSRACIWIETVDLSRPIDPTGQTSVPGFVRASNKRAMATARPIGRNQIGRLDRLRNTKRLRALQSCPV